MQNFVFFEKKRSNLTLYFVVVIALEDRKFKKTMGGYM
jgi:hypothetical protein